MSRAVSAYRAVIAAGFARATPGAVLQRLSNLGFGPSLTAQLDPEPVPPSHVGRVVFASRDRARVFGLEGETQAICPGLPVVIGDWVVFEPGDPAVIRRVLDPDSSLHRRDPGGGVQVIATNVDRALICSPADAALSVRRLERCLAIAAESRVAPVIVLTKADLCADVAVAVAEVAAVCDAPCVAVDASPGGTAALAPFLVPGETAALVGLSGVGKSTLVNGLLGAEVRLTGAIRADDRRGRHTTSDRLLLRLPNGAWLLDNPGVRQVGVIGGAGVAEVFADIDALVGECRFRDCTHDSEPGCAVAAAVDAGELDPGRHAAWLKLQRELAFESRRDDPRAARQERDRRWRERRSGRQRGAERASRRALDDLDDRDG